MSPEPPAIDLALAPTDLDRIAAVLRLLGNPTVLAILIATRPGTLAVGDLAAAAGISLQATSDHLQSLRVAGLVAPVRRGNRVHYTPTAFGRGRIDAALSF